MSVMGISLCKSLRKLGLKKKKSDSIPVLMGYGILEKRRIGPVYNYGTGFSHGN